MDLGESDVSPTAQKEGVIKATGLSSVMRLSGRNNTLCMREGRSPYREWASSLA